MLLRAPGVASATPDSSRIPSDVQAGPQPREPLRLEVMDAQGAPNGGQLQDVASGSQHGAPNRAMTIVYLTNQFPPNIWGGMGIFVHFLTDQLGRNNRLRVYTTNPGGLAATEEHGNVKIFRPGRAFLQPFMRRKKSNGHYTWFANLVKIVDLLFNNIDAFLLLRKHVRSERPDLIVVHDFMHSLAGLLCKLFLDVPIVFHVHFVEFTMTPSGRLKDPLGIIRFFESTLARVARNVIVGTREMKQLMVRNGWTAEKIAVVPLCNVNDDSHLIDPSDPRLQARAREIRRELGIGEDEKMIVYAGRLVHLKGVFNLIPATRLLADRIGKVKLVLVGEGNQQKLESLIRSLGLEEHVHLYNRFLSREEVLCHYLAAEVCVFPSFQEPFGLVALEAMSLGRPIILGTGFSRIFEGRPDRPNVLYVDPRSPEEIADRAATLLENPRWAAAMGRRARHYIQENFSREKVIALTLDTYRQAAKAC